MTAEEIIELIKRNPGELAFVYISRTYADYLQTYLDAGDSVDEALYTEEEFNVLKDCFGTDTFH